MVPGENVGLCFSYDKEMINSATELTLYIDQVRHASCNIKVDMLGSHFWIPFTDIAVDLSAFVALCLYCCNWSMMLNIHCFIYVLIHDKNGEVVILYYSLRCQISYCYCMLWSSLIIIKCNIPTNISG